MNKQLYSLNFSLKKDFQRQIISIVFFFVCVFLVINLFLKFVAFPVRQTSISMEPDVALKSCIMFTPLKKEYSRGDIVLVKPRSHRIRTNKQRVLDSLVSFFTAQAVVPSKHNHYMGDESQMRRVIGLPGDQIYMRDYVLYVKPKGNNSFLTEFERIDMDKSYNVSILAAPSGWDSAIGVNGSFDEIELGNDEYFVLGDTRNSSTDSRLWGPVKTKDIRAKALFRYLPLNKITVY